MAKWHGFGRCKTRLSKDIGKSNSAKVQSVMTKHTISVANFLQENKLIDISIAITGMGVGNCRKWSRDCLLYTSPSPRDKRQSRMPSSA